MTEECLFEILGSPESEELARLDGKPLSKNLPSQLVKAVAWVDWIDEDDEDFRIIDLGEAFLQGAETKKLAQPSSLQAPETIFTDTFDHRLDLWRAGIVVRNLRFDFFGRVLTSRLARYILLYSGTFHFTYTWGIWIS